MNKKRKESPKTRIKKGRRKKRKKKLEKRKAVNHIPSHSVVAFRRPPSSFIRRKKSRGENTKRKNRKKQKPNPNPENQTLDHDPSHGRPQTSLQRELGSPHSHKTPKTTQNGLRLRDPEPPSTKPRKSTRNTVPKGTNVAWSFPASYRWDTPETKRFSGEERGFPARKMIRKMKKGQKKIEGENSRKGRRENESLENRKRARTG